jgi:asparagine N-glycosylation enzyme membrane subunit Stt3
MRFLKQYFGVIVILLAVALLAFNFYSGEPSNTILLVALVMVIVGILLMIFGGRAADKIGGK